MFNLFNCLVHFDFGGIYIYRYILAVTSICTTKWRSKFHGTSRWRISRGSEIHEIGSSSKQRQCPLLQLSFQSFGTAHPLTSIINTIFMFLFFLDSSLVRKSIIKTSSSAWCFYASTLLNVSKPRRTRSRSKRDSSQARCT